MHPGDFIIAPAWTWRDRGSEADGPVVWLDGLDVPLVSLLWTGFREEHEEIRHPAGRPEGDTIARYGSGLLPLEQRSEFSTSPIFSYLYERTPEALYRITNASEPDAWHGHALRCVNPTNGVWAMPTSRLQCVYFQPAFDHGNTAQQMALSRWLLG